MSEKLRLCTDFAELRAGMLVVVRGCGHGCGDHRGIIANFTSGAACRSSNGACVTEDTWEVLPAGRCGASHIGRYDVDVHRCVYIVDTGNDDYEERAEGRQLVQAVPYYRRSVTGL